jgi:uncharacterized protein (DUF1800 family)
VNRLGFGARPGEVERLLDEGLDRAVERLLAPAPEEPEVERRLVGYPGMHRTIDEIVKEHQRLDFSRAPVEAALEDMRAVKLTRAVHAEHPLREVLADFWYNHFNVYAYSWEPSIPGYEREAIRPHCLGSFRGLLHATARHPSMLFFLDNFLNVADRTVNGALVRGINENYGRELLELHTVGVDAGYTQADVQEAARTLTGWDFGGWGVYKYTYNHEKHDTAPKSVFGLELPAGGGEDEGLRLLDYLAAHPLTARFVAHRMVERFVSDEPPASLTDRCAQVFLSSKGEGLAMVRAILQSDEFWAPSSVGSKVKTPFEYAVSVLRALQADVGQARSVVAALAAMGMPLYGCMPPTGYSNHGGSWLSAQSQVYRFQFAFQAAGRALAGVTVPADLLEGRGKPSKLAEWFAREVLGSRVTKATLRTAGSRTASDGVPAAAKVAGVLLASPEFQMR